MPRTVKLFESWGAFVNEAVNRENIHGRTLSRDIENDEELGKDGANYCKTFEDCVELAETGWPEGASKVSALTSVIMDRVTSLVQRDTLEFNVVGNDFDVSLFNQGIPEHWYVMPSKFENGVGSRVVRVTLNCSVSCGLGEAVIAKGAVITALIQALEFSGIRVEVVLAETTANARWREPDHKLEPDQHACDIFVPLKAADQPLDIDRLVFALAHPDVERRLMFSVQEGWPEFCKGIFGYGCPIPAMTADQGDIYIEDSYGGDRQWTDEVRTVDWILDQLKKQGVRTTDDFAEAIPDKEENEDGFA